MAGPLIRSLDHFVRIWYGALHTSCGAWCIWYGAAPHEVRCGFAVGTYYGTGATHG
jgi:hypothetical protein